jgi:hypothetical protein
VPAGIAAAVMDANGRARRAGALSGNGADPSPRSPKTCRPLEPAVHDAGCVIARQAVDGEAIR